MTFFEYYIQSEFNLSDAIKEYAANEDKNFTLAEFKKQLKKPEFKEKWDECAQLEKDQIKESLKKLAMGIPINDPQGKILGWQSPPDLKAIEDFLYKLDKNKF